jgi:hypothetical protein
MGGTVEDTRLKLTIPELVRSSPVPVAESTIRRAGRGFAIVICGRLIRFRHSDLERWIEENRIEPVDFKASLPRRAASGAV